MSINPYTLRALTDTGTIPHTYIHGQEAKEIRYNPYIVNDHLRRVNKISLNSNNQNELDDIRNYFNTTAPDVVKNLKKIDSGFAQRRVPKGYSLTKVKNKQYGFLYYVRYFHNGRTISRYNTHTNNLALAEKWAVDNRDRIINEYYAKRTPGYAKNSFYDILSTAYKEDSPYDEWAATHGKMITERVRSLYNNCMVDILIPYLKNHGVKTAHDVRPSLISKLQIYLSKKGISPYTINRKISLLAMIFDYLVAEEIITDNVFRKVSKLKGHKNHAKTKDIHDIDKIKGKFDHMWKGEETEYILNMLINCTGMRNSEIVQIKLKDIFRQNNSHFIFVHGTKSENCPRYMILHPTLHRMLIKYALKNKIANDDYLFPDTNSYTFDKACFALAKRIYPKTPHNELREYLDKNNITYYSGRHSWKTLMRANKLGDVEEYFMGHKLTPDVAEIYNHKNRQGQRNIFKKAKDIVRILDRRVFTAKNRSKKT